MKDGLWNRIITAKYLHNQSVATWLRQMRFNTRRVSIIWRGFIQNLLWLGGHLAWQVGNGIDIWIGVDLIVGNSSPYSLPAELRSFLEDLDIRTLSQAHNILPNSQHYWYTAEDLGIAGDWKDAWDAYTARLAQGGIHLTTQANSLAWDFNKKDGSLTAKLAYDRIVKHYSPQAGNCMDSFIWNRALPRKIGCFTWLVFRNKIPTWDNLQKRGWTGPGICVLCNLDEEAISHLFNK